MVTEKRAKLILSQETLSGYWLDYVFQCAKDLNFDGIDLALWKNFDARNVGYVSKLVEKYQIPVNVIQVSSKVNRKELDMAVNISNAVWSQIICINAPLRYQLETYRFITSNIAAYKRHNSNIKFCIVNPPNSNLFSLPISKYYFANPVEIITKLKAQLWLDISNLDETVLESSFLRKMSNFVPHIWVVYLSDKDKLWKSHQPLWSWILKLPSLLKKFKQTEYYWYFSLKLDIEKKDLADMEKVEQIIKKCRLYYKENFEELVIK